MASGVGRLVLVLEDGFLVGEGLKRMLEAHSYEVIGPTHAIDDALEIIEREDIHAAVLDLNIRGSSSVPVARRLLEIGCPFIFVTGYGTSTVLPVDLRDVPRLPKPVQSERLVAVIAKIVARRDD